MQLADSSRVGNSLKRTEVATGKTGVGGGGRRGIGLEMNEASLFPPTYLFFAAG